MRLLFAGTPQVAVASLDALVRSQHDVVAVLTRPDTVAGRGRRPVRSAVAERADALGLPVSTLSPRDPGFAPWLAGLAVDCCPVVAFGALIPPEALDIPAQGWVNLHFSLLPQWRGAAPVQHAVLNGDTVTGASTFRLDAGLDTGPVFGTVEEPIGPRDTSGDILDRLARRGATLIVSTMDGLADGSLVAVPHADPRGAGARARRGGSLRRHPARRAAIGHPTPARSGGVTGAGEGCGALRTPRRR
jgi:methionyl-tRNA formyltransferase